MVEFARTLIRGDFAANDRYEQRLDDEGWEGWPPFLSALFFLAVDRKFEGRYDQGKVIRFVADLRADADEDESKLNPSETELLIRACFDPQAELTMSPDTIGQIQTLVAYTILSQENLSDKELDDILTEAQEIVADQS